MKTMDFCVLHVLLESDIFQWTPFLHKGYIRLVLLCVSI
jgi:hypothetical protein